MHHSTMTDSNVTSPLEIIVDVENKNVGMQVVSRDVFKILKLNYLKVLCKIYNGNSKNY